MSSRFFASHHFRNRLLLSLFATGLLLGLSAAALTSHQEAEAPLTRLVPGLGDRYMTVEQLLEQGSKGKLGKSVKLQGQVVMRSPLLNGIVYQLQDRTGTIWIQSQDAQIGVGEVLTVQGQPIYEEIILEGLDFGTFYIQEKQRIVANTI